MRTIIEIPGAQIEGLDRHCQREGISRAEGVRRAVALMIGQPSEPDAHAAFGLWKNRRRKVDGLEFQKRLRREWSERGTS